MCQALWKRIAGGSVLPCTITTDSEANSDAARAYATEFSDGSLGIMVTHQSETNATRVTVSGVAAGVKRQAAFFGKKAVANVWILHANLSSLTPATGASATSPPSPLDAPAVLINGVGNGASLGGPWPFDSIEPYIVKAASTAQDLTFDLPAGSLAAIVVHGARPPAPSPPPYPPYPPPSPPPPCYTQQYGNCFNSHCCVKFSAFGCYKRVGRMYAQCRPLPGHAHVPPGPCVNTTDWLCPGWWEDTMQNDGGEDGESGEGGKGGESDGVDMAEIPELWHSAGA